MVQQPAGRRGIITRPAVIARPEVAARPGTGASRRAQPRAGGTPGRRRAPVFADLSGRRLRRMRLAGIAAGAVLASCLVVLAVGLLGGPKAPFIPWSTHDRGGAPGPSGQSADGVAATPTPGPDAWPVSPSPGRATARPTGSPAVSQSAAASAAPAPAVTNRASKTPPGLNRTPPPKHTSAP